MAGVAIQLYDKQGRKAYSAPYWPINSIYISVENKNPSAYFGGTWVSFGAGRCLVGVDANQTEFATVQKTGGHKSLQAHTHTLNNHTHEVNITTSWGGAHGHRMPFNMTDKVEPHVMDYFNYGGYGMSSYYIWTQNDGAHNHTVQGWTGTNNGATTSAGGGNAQNLQPYITVYFWRRTA